MNQETYCGGIDAHVKFCQFSILDPEGGELLNAEVNTSARDLVRFVKKAPKPLHLLVESSSLTEWVIRTIEPYVERIEACDPRQNKWICSSDKSTDKVDAYKLAQLLRANLYNPVHIPAVDRQLFKEAVLDYHKTTKEIVRVKNRIKAKFRSRGISTDGATLYSKRGREHYLPLLDSRDRVEFVWFYFEQLDHLIEQKRRLLQSLRSRSKRYPAIANFMTMPGVGFIVAMTFFALVDTPERFERKEHLWSYCRLGVNKKTSAGKTKGGGQKGGSRLLKSMLMKAAEAATSSRLKRSNEFLLHHQAMIARGCDWRTARRSTARKIGSRLYGMFKNGQPYRSEVTDESQT